MKNMQESVQDDESVTNKFMDNQSEIQSEKNIAIMTSNKIGAKSSFNNKFSNPSSSKIITANQNNNNPTNFSINLNPKVRDANITSSNENLENISKNKNSGKKIISKNKNFNNNDNFAIPPSRKNMNNSTSNNLNLNISLNLSEVDNKQNISPKNKSNIPNKNSKKISLMEKNNYNIILPLNEENPFSFVNINQKEEDENSENDDNNQYLNLNPELQKLKEEYNKVKNYLDTNKSEHPEFKDKEKLKKKLKKRLKQIKDIFKEKTNI